MISNLPTTQTTGNPEVRQFFDKYFQTQLTFPAGQIDAVLGFFIKQGFSAESAKTVSIILLNQAKLDNVNVMSLLDSLKVLTNIQLSQVVAQVLNAYREKTSLLGYRINPVVDTFESRNILI